MLSSRNKREGHYVGYSGKHVRWNIMRPRYGFYVNSYVAGNVRKYKR